MSEQPALEVLRTFFRLGLTSFGGPVAHLGYFHAEVVVRRRWIDEAAYTDLVALCQFLPGPASSKVGFALGLQRAGYLGGLAAWVGFTLPSAALMLAFAFGAHRLTGPAGTGLLHGLKLVAVAVVAQAVWVMARSLCPDWQRASIAILVACLILAGAAALPQAVLIAAGGVAGLWLCRGVAVVQLPATGTLIPARTGIVALLLFAALLAGLPLLATLVPVDGIALFAAFYRTGALVFGGGHVALPLLHQEAVEPGWVSNEAFLAGYGVAQAMPGPLFTIAAYLGAIANLSTRGLVGAVIALAAIFLPGILIVLGTLPVWDRLRAVTGARAALSGINAAVVGLLAAALVDPLWRNSVASLADVGVVLAGFLALTRWRAPSVLIVALGALAGALIGWLGGV